MRLDDKFILLWRNLTDDYYIWAHLCLRAGGYLFRLLRYGSLKYLLQSAPASGLNLVCRLSFPGD